MRLPAKLARPTAKLLEQLMHTGDGVCAVDAHQRIILWNKAASSLLGYTPAEVLGKYCYDVIQAKDCDGEMLCEKQCCYIEQAEKSPWRAHQLFQALPKTGETVWMDVTTLSVLSPQRELSALVHIFQQTEPTKRATPAARLQRPSPGETMPISGRENVPAAPFPLSKREMAVLRLLAKGASTKEIAAQLFISPVTVRNHIQNILRKLKVHSRLEAILWVLRRLV